MGEDCRSLPPELHFDWQSAYLNSLGAQPYLGQQDIIPASMNPSTNLVLANGTLPLCASSMAPHLWAARPREPHGWFNGLPSIQQAFMPTSNSILKGELSICPNGRFSETLNPNVELGYAQKKFLVIDQSGDQTSMLFNPCIGAPVGCFTSLNANPCSTYNFSDVTGARNTLKNLAQPIPTDDECNQSNENGIQSEMHEDTEELNALLYSDDGTDFSEDDEVTSTGHSPSILTASDKHNWFEGTHFEGNAEVASSDGTTKKQKLLNECYDKLSVMDTASSVKHGRSFEFEDGAESCCSSKKMRKEKICKTVSILQSIIPGGKGKDAMLVLDEAIQYLKLLKHQAEAFGFFFGELSAIYCAQKKEVESLVYILEFGESNNPIPPGVEVGMWTREKRARPVAVGAQVFTLLPLFVILVHIHILSWATFFLLMYKNCTSNLFSPFHIQVVRGTHIHHCMFHAIFCLPSSYGDQFDGYCYFDYCLRLLFA